MRASELILLLLLVWCGGCSVPAIQIGPATQPAVEAVIEPGALTVEKGAVGLHVEPGAVQVKVEVPSGPFDKAATWVGVACAAVVLYFVGWLKQSPLRAPSKGRR